jgi:hypothetical protein
VRRLRGQAPTLTLPLNWLSQRLAENGQTIENLVQQESQKQASDQISISNSIGSLRFLTSMNWRTFVEDMSAVEKILRQDPALIYPEMNFTTRDKYRHTIERIAKSSRLTETEIAEMAIHLATQSAAETGLDNRRTHVGYYLLAEGLATLEDATETQFSLKQKPNVSREIHIQTLHRGYFSPYIGGDRYIDQSCGGRSGSPLFSRLVPALRFIDEQPVCRRLA